jgi:hypothetical protein
MRETVIVCSRIVVVMGKRMIFVSIMPRETPLIVVMCGFVLTMMSALFVVIMVSVVVDGRPFAELFIVSGESGRLNRAIA